MALFFLMAQVFLMAQGLVPIYTRYMDTGAEKNNAALRLHPSIEPYDRQTLNVGDGHRLYVEQSGNPSGLPVVVLHGGPGGGSSPAMRRFFDPSLYRIILFDQRGCGRSHPHASIENNTTWHLVEDIEKIRQKLGIEKWVVFGGSWGATLALIYAQAHAKRVSALVLRGVFLATKAELDWFYGGGAGRFWPEHWERFEQLIPPAERHNMVAAYHRRLFSGNKAEEITYAKAWAAWENALASINNIGAMPDMPAEYARAFARIENHYFTHGAFLDEDGKILRDMSRIAHIPGVIVQGRHDMICPPVSAWKLQQSWPACDLRMVHLAGHAMSERGIANELIEVMQRLADRQDTLN